MINNSGCNPKKGPSLGFSGLHVSNVRDGPLILTKTIYIQNYNIDYTGVQPWETCNNDNRHQDSGCSLHSFRTREDNPHDGDCERQRRGRIIDNPTGDSRRIIGLLLRQAIGQVHRPSIPRGGPFQQLNTQPAHTLKDTPSSVCAGQFSGVRIDVDYITGGQIDRCCHDQRTMQRLFPLREVAEDRHNWVRDRRDAPCNPRRGLPVLRKTEQDKVGGHRLEEAR